MAIETVGSITVISDVGENANSYSSVANVKEQWDKNPNIDYSALDDEAIGQLAILATESLDLEYGTDYAGTLYNNEYALFWPRVGVKDRRGVAITDYTVFPRDLANAVAAQAWWLNQVDFVALGVSSLSGIKSQELEGLGKKEFFDIGSQRSALYKSPVSKDANKWLEGLVIGGTGGYTSVMMRG